jgi:hypothetical protein
MTDFDFGSVYGSAQHGRTSAMMAILGRITGFRAHRPDAATRKQGRDGSKSGRTERAYLADIGMEIGF